MYFMIEVEDPADIGKSEINRWLLHEVESVQDGDYESIGAFGIMVHPATNGDVK